MDDPEAKGKLHGKVTARLRTLLQRELPLIDQPRAVMLLALSYAISFKPGEGQRFLDRLHSHASDALEKIDAMRKRGDFPPTTNHQPPTRRH